MASSPTVSQNNHRIAPNNDTRGAHPRCHITIQNKNSNIEPIFQRVEEIIHIIYGPVLAELLVDGVLDVGVGVLAIIIKQDALLVLGDFVEAPGVVDAISGVFVDVAGEVTEVVELV